MLTVGFLVNKACSVVTCLIFCAGLCSALKMRSKLGFVVSAVLLDVIVVVSQFTGFLVNELAVVNLLGKAAILPLMFGSESRLNCVIKGVTAMFLNAASACIMVVLMSMFNSGVTLSVYINEMPVVQIVLYYVAYWVAYVPIVYLHALICKGAPRQEMGSVIVPFAGMLVVAMFIVSIGQSFYSSDAMRGGIGEYLAYLVALVLNFVACGYLILRLVVYQRVQTELSNREMLNEQLRAIQRGYRDVLDSQQRIRKIRHDLANHLSTIQCLTAVGMVDDAREYLETMLAAIPQSESACADSCGVGEQGDLGIFEMPELANVQEEPQPAAAGDELERPGKFAAFQGKLKERLWVADMRPSIVAGILVILTQLFVVALVSLRTAQKGLVWFAFPGAFGFAIVCIAVDAVVLGVIVAQERRTAKARSSVSAKMMGQALERFREFARYQSDLAVTLEQDVRAKIAKGMSPDGEFDILAQQRILGGEIEKADAASAHLCDCLVANVVVNMEKQLAEAEGIRFTCKLKIPANLNLPAMQLAAILFNLLDNARRACLDLGQSDLWVDIEAYCKNGNLAIVVKNSCDGSLRGEIKPRHISLVKADDHGWGLSIVNELVALYDGITLYEAKDGVYRAQIAVPVLVG